MSTCPQCTAYNNCFASKLNKKEVIDLEKRIAIKKYKRGDPVFKEKSFGKYIYMVLSGDLKAECEDNTGKPIIMRVSRKGEYLGMEVILPGKIYLMSVSAMRPSEVCAIPVSSIEEVIFSNKEACITLMNNMKNKIEQLFKYTLVMITGNAQSRLAFALLSLGGNEGRVSISKEEIARMTGLTRETVSRKLGLFNSQKFIEFIQRDVQILRPEALRKLAN